MVKVRGEEKKFVSKKGKIKIICLILCIVICGTIINHYVIGGMKNMVEVKLLEEREDGIKKFLIQNDKVKVVCLNKGCRIMEIHTPDKDGKMEDITLGLKSIDDCDKDPKYLGVVVGRFANRIAKGEFELNGKKYQLNKNDGPNTLHGGNAGFDKKIFDDEKLENGIRFSYLSPDGEEGYPGNLQLDVEYVLEGNELIVRYIAKSDADTIANFTNHTYFNLSGTKSSIENHYLRIDANKVGEVNSDCMATGELFDVENTPFDFREMKKVGKDLHEENEQLKNGGGYDHPFILKGTENQICLEERESGRRLTITTDVPTVQFYSGNVLGNGCVGKDGTAYDNREGLALEPEYMPDSINLEGEDSPVILRKGDVSINVTKYRFDVM